MIGAGGGIGAGCANKTDETVTANANEAAERPILRMSSSRESSQRFQWRVLRAARLKCYINFASKRKWRRHVFIAVHGLLSALCVRSRQRSNSATLGKRMLSWTGPYQSISRNNTFTPSPRVAGTI
jgi:hypothetical protein